MFCAQLSKLREKLEAIAKELESTDRETFLTSVAAERAAELASLPLKEASTPAKSEAADIAEHKAESHGKLKPKGRKPKKQMKPQINEMEEAEKRPKLFEPAAGPPPKIGEEELQAEGSGHEILLQVCRQNSSILPALAKNTCTRHVYTLCHCTTLNAAQPQTSTSLFTTKQCRVCLERCCPATLRQSATRAASTAADRRLESALMLSVECLVAHHLPDVLHRVSTGSHGSKGGTTN